MPKCPECGGNHALGLTPHEMDVLLGTAQMLVALAETVAGVVELHVDARTVILNTLRAASVQHANGTISSRAPVLLAATTAELANAIERIAEIVGT